jgi:hypothetical protein
MVHKEVISDQVFAGLINEREIWWAATDDNQFFEQPVLVLKKFDTEKVLAVPLASRPKTNAYYFYCADKGLPTAGTLSQLKLLSPNRFTRRIRKLESTLFTHIKNHIVKLLL